mgnify:CR=1 FL=1
MLVGVVSDTHNNIKSVKAIIDIFNKEEVDYVIHTGDISKASTLQMFSNLNCKFLGVFGNNDRNEIGLEEVCEEFNFNFQEPTEYFFYHKIPVQCHIQNRNSENHRETCRLTCLTIKNGFIKPRETLEKNSRMKVFYPAYAPFETANASTR